VVHQSQGRRHADARRHHRRADVAWSSLGFTDAELDELAEHLLRIIQSFVLDPGRPPRRAAALRAYLRRWVAPAVDTARVSGPA
jgi:hypothetical protein